MSFEPVGEARPRVQSSKPAGESWAAYGRRVADAGLMMASCSCGWSAGPYPNTYGGQQSARRSHGDHVAQLRAVAQRERREAQRW